MKTENLSEIIDRQAKDAFSYPEVGATDGVLPTGYTIDHHRCRVGMGRDAFESAKSALNSWKMYPLPWTRAYAGESKPYVGQSVVIKVKVLGFWTENPLRVVYLKESQGQVDSYRFAVGTVAGHYEMGEERFGLEWHHDDDSVWYDILAFSKAGRWLSKLGYFYARRLQKRFAKDSLQAMRKASLRA